MEGVKEEEGRKKTEIQKGKGRKKGKEVQNKEEEGNKKMSYKVHVGTRRGEEGSSETKG